MSPNPGPSDGSPVAPSPEGPVEGVPDDPGDGATSLSEEGAQSSEKRATGGPFEEFDLTPFRGQLRAGRRQGFRVLLALGIVFTVGGIAAAAFGTVEAGFSSLISFAVVAVFCAIGFFPLLFLYAPSREWRYPRSLRIDADGFKLIDSGGHETPFRWTQPGLVISIRKTEVAHLTPDGGPVGEILLTVPYAFCAISKEARQSLLIESEANGLTVAEDRFVAADDTLAGRPEPSITYTAMRLASDAHAPPTFAQTSTEASDSVAPGAVFDLPEEVPPPPERSWDDPSKNPLKSLTFAPDGITFAQRKGRSQVYNWSDPKWTATMIRRLNSPLEVMADSQSNWRISLRSPNANGELSGEAYDALVAEARRAGREVCSTKSPDPVPPHSFWIAETSIRHPPKPRPPTT